MSIEKKYTEEEMKAMKTDEISPDELEHVSGGHYLKDGTPITDDVVDFYANVFKGSGLHADALSVSAENFGFPFVKPNSLEDAEKDGVNPVDVWSSVMKRIINEGGFISH